jgi:tape measure domain-containing protein
MAQVEDLKIILKVQDAGGTQVVEKLKNQLAGLQRSANQASKSGIDEVARGIRAFDASGKKNIETLRNQISAMKALREQAAIGSTQFKRLSADVDKYSAALAKAEGQKRGGGFAGRATKTVGAIAGAGVFGGAEGALGAGIGAFFGPGGAVVGGAIGAQVGGMRQALGATAEYEAGLKKLRVALFGVTTSSEEYHEALSFIRDSTEQYAIPQEVLTRQFTKLQASVQGAGGNLEDTKVAFNGIVAAVRATGGSLADVDAALTATAQVFSKGKVSAEELRQQIGERLPGAFTIFAQSMGKTPAELDKALEQGQVSLEDFQKFAESLFERYGETAQEIAKGPESAGDRLKVALEEMNESVGRLLGPVGVAFQETFIEIVKWIDIAAKRLNIFFGIGVEGLGERVKDLAIKLTDAKTELAGIPVPQGTMGMRDEDGNLIFTTRYSLVEDRIKKLDAQLLRARDQLEMAIEEQESFDIAQATAGTGLAYGGTQDSPKPKPRLGRGPSGPKDISDLQREAQVAAILASERQKDFEVRKKALVLQRQAAIKAAEELEPNKKIVAIARANRDFRVEMLKLTDDMRKADDERLRKAQEIAKAEQAAAAARFGLRKSLGLTTRSEEVAEAQRIYKEQHGKFATDQDLDLIRQQLDPTVIESLQSAIRGTSKELDKLIGSANQIVSGANAIGTAFANSFKSAIDGSVTAKEALAGFFRDVGKYFLDMAAQIIQKMITMAILNQLTGLLPGGGGGGGASGGGDIFADIASRGGLRMKNGGVFGKNGIVPFAKGGIVSKPTLFQYANGGTGRFGLMGEAGPEAIMPLRRTSSGRLGVEASGRAGVTVGTINIKVENSGDQLSPAAQKQIAGQVQGIVISTLANERRSGGML